LKVYKNAALKSSVKSSSN